jgi:hypothetical protein
LQESEHHQEWRVPSVVKFQSGNVASIFRRFQYSEIQAHRSAFCLGSNYGADFGQIGECAAILSRKTNAPLKESEQPDFPGFRVKKAP